jgi:hypothetical protein
LVLPACLDYRAPRSERAVRTALCGLCALGPWLAWLAHLAATGRLEDFVVTLRFNLAHAEVSRQPLLEGLVSRILHAWDELLPLYLCAGVALLPASNAGMDDRTEPRVRSAWWLAGTWVLCLLQVFWQAKFWTHHYRVVLLPLCFGAGLGVHALQLALRRPAARRPLVMGALACALTIASLPYLGSMSRYASLHRMLPGALDSARTEARLATYTWSGQDYDVLETAHVATRLARETSAGDRVFVWGFEPGIYIQSHRLAATRFFYDYPLQPSFGSVHPKLFEQLMADLREHPPARVLILRRDRNALETEESAVQLMALPVLRSFLEQRYEHAWTLGDFEVLSPRAGGPRGGWAP